ncbi:MAG: crosslink repair DNA glycosylase YcaQ family protein [Anaerolineaceae bacterium]|nr:crosslink repair DNA glycosylase YcaQ family protein [Anaerolineaceae bacterium]
MKVTQPQIDQYRMKTYRMLPGKHLAGPNDAVKFVNERGFAYLWPIKNVEMPNLWNATTGNRPVANDHDDPGHATWGWKDELLDKRVWYYARIIKNRNTFVSHELIPYFYALSPNYGDPEEDFQDQYQQGLMTLETKLIFEALLKEGPLDTISLRKAAHQTSKNSDSGFTKALDTLQSQLKVLPMGITNAGRWGYAFAYDLTHRYYPDLMEQARSIRESAARQKIVATYLESVGAATVKDIGRIFQWTPELTQRTLNSLISSELIFEVEPFEGEKANLFISKSVLTL